MTHPELLRKLATTWKGRREVLGLKPGSKTHAAAQLHFFMGAFVAAESLGQPLNPMMLVMLSVGRDSVEEFCRDQPPETPPCLNSNALPETS